VTAAAPGRSSPRRWAATLAAALVGGAAVWALGRYRARDAAGRLELAPVDRATAEGVAAQVALRGVDVRLERTLDLRVEPAVERFTLVYPQHAERQVQRHVSRLLAGGRPQVRPAGPNPAGGAGRRGTA
jgi:hypothetical protein